MKKTLNEEIVATVRNSLPDNESIVSFLSGLFGWNKEAIYRRLRCEIAFTYQDMVIMAGKLNFSIDNIIRANQSRHVVFDLCMLNDVESTDLYCKKRSRLTNLSYEISQAQSSESLFAVNYLPYSLVIFHQTLSKFEYFKWMHQTQSLPPDVNMSGVTMPSKLVDMRSGWLQQDRRNSEVVYILDSNVFLSVITEITYFYKRSLINNEEIDSLKSDLLLLIDQMVAICKSGVAHTGARVQLYLTPLNVSTNHFYIKYDDSVWCYVEVYGIDILQSFYPEACATQRLWIERQQRYATLVTGCNEKQMFEYFDQQRIYVNNMGT